MTRAASAIVAVLGSTACSVPDVMFTKLPASIDAAQDTPAPAPFAPLHVPRDAIPAEAGALVFDAPTIVDTTMLTINSATSPYFVQQTDGDTVYAVLFASSVVVQSPIQITGSRPLIMIATQAVTVAADIDLSGHAGAAGPGALPAGAGAGGNGGTAVVAQGEIRVSGGGGGGGYGTAGAPGAGEGPAALPGDGGQQYGNSPADPLVGGGFGGNGGNAGAGGGGGGGALQISSAVSIDVTSAAVNAGGGGGAGGDLSNGGGGGGAGGEVLLEAPVIRVVGVVAANGGGGGGGGAANPTGHIDRIPTAGDPGTAGPQPATGGLAGLPAGGKGGTGAAGVAVMFSQAEPGAAGEEKGGGGGGGAGRIWLRSRAATLPDLASAVISPPPDLDLTLP